MKKDILTFQLSRQLQSLLPCDIKIDQVKKEWERYHGFREGHGAFIRGIEKTVQVP